MLKVGSKFYTFDELSKRLEEFQQVEKVQLWVRDSRTVVAAAKRARRKSLNPALKYAELTYSCVFGGRRPSDQTKTHNQTSAGGCPFKVRLSTSIDGQALVVKEICHDHNHEPGKKLHEEPRRLYKKTPNRTSVRKPVRYIVNKQRVSGSSDAKNTKGRVDNSESHIQLGQSPFHHLHLHQQQYQQQQQQIKLQLQQHLQQQQQQQQQLRQRQAEVIQLDSPDHIDTPDHLSSPDLSTTFDQLGSLNNSVDQYSYLPPSPISPSLSSGCLLDCEEDERLEPILDLEEALEEALGDLDSVGSMEVDANLRLSSLGSSTPTLVLSQSEVHSGDDHAGPPPAKRQRGRPRKQSFTGTPPGKEKYDRDHSDDSKECDSSPKEGDFVGFSNSMDKGKGESAGLSKADIAQANAMARQLHVYKPGIDFVPGARLEVLDARDNNWYQCKVVEVDWGELDILVHYERWSNRFDEWLKMDSTRIRPLVRASSRREKRGGPFSVGNKVTARWPADGKRYRAKITKCLGDDQYEVLFFDGVTKIIRAGGLTKMECKSPRATGEGESSSDDPSTSSPRKQGQDYDDVMLLSPAGTTASSNDSQPSSPEPFTGDKPPGMKLGAFTPRKSIFDIEIMEQKRKPKRKAALEELFQSIKKRRRYEYSPPARSQQESRSKPKKRRRDLSSADKGPVAGPSSRSEGPPLGDTGERSACDSPMPNPFPKTVIVAMEDGWRKCCARRMQKGVTAKWDVYFITPEDKKIRSRHDLHRYMVDGGLGYDAEKFDFSIKNLKALIQSHLQELEEKDVALGVDAKPKSCETLVIPDSAVSSFYKEFKVSWMFANAKESQKPTLQEYLQKSSASSSLSVLDESKRFLADKPWETASLSKESFKASSSGKEQGREKKPLMSFPIKVEPFDDYIDSQHHIEARETEIVEIKKEKVDPPAISPEPSSFPKPSIGKKSDGKMKIEIPIMPKTEPLGSVSAGLLAAARPWSLSTEAVKEEDKSISGPPSASASCTPPGGPAKQSATPSRQKQTIKKEPVLAPNEFVVKSQHNEHMCPKSGCLKSFRKENLLQMHIKHYHPEILKKGRAVAPNVADLAYARTVGDHLDMNISSSLAPPPVEKLSKGEGKKSHQFGSPGEPRTKPTDKKSHGGSGSLASSSTKKAPKDVKKKEPIKTESVKGKPTLMDEKDIKLEIDDYVDDLEDEERAVGGVAIVDPDYIPTDADKKKARRKRTRSELKSKKRKSVSEAGPTEPSSSTVAVKKVPKTEEPTVVEKTEEDIPVTDTWGEVVESSSVPEAPQEIINCGCGSTEEEGLMLQCDVCLCWQHGACYNIVREDQVPDKYICSLCDHPRLERSSHKFRHHQDWLKEGRIPRFSFSRTRGDARLESCVRRGHELTANVLQLSQVLHSLRLKLHIAKEADHPKFVMWHKKWNEKEEVGEPSNEGATGASTSAEAMERMQDLLDIVGHEGSSLPNQDIASSIMPDPQLLANVIEAVSAPSESQQMGEVSTPAFSANADINMQESKHTLTSQTTDEPMTTQVPDSIEKTSDIHDQKATDTQAAEVVKPDIYQDVEDVKPDIYQDVEDVKPDIYQDVEDVKPDIYEDVEDVKPDIYQDVEDVKPEIYQDVEDVKPETYQDVEDVKPDINDVEGVKTSDVQEGIMGETQDVDKTCSESDTKLSLPEAVSSEKQVSSDYELSIKEEVTDIDSVMSKQSSSIDVSQTCDEVSVTSKDAVGDPTSVIKTEEDSNDCTGELVTDTAYENTPENISQTVIKQEEDSDKFESRDEEGQEMEEGVTGADAVFSLTEENQALSSVMNKEEKEPKNYDMQANVTNLGGADASEDALVTDLKPDISTTMIEGLEEVEDKSIGTTEEEKTDPLEQRDKASGDTEPSTSSLRDEHGVTDAETEMKKSSEEIVGGEIKEEKSDTSEQSEKVSGEAEPLAVSSLGDEPGIIDTETEMKKSSEETVGDVVGHIKEEEDTESRIIGKGETAEGDVNKEANASLDISGEPNKAGSPTSEAVTDSNEVNTDNETSRPEIVKPELVKQQGGAAGELDEIEITDVVGRELDGIELPHPGDMDASDLAHPVDLDGDAHLDVGDDLALDLAGLEGSAETGMPENSDLAALLSSQTELEQLVTQASSELASHVPLSSSQPVRAPIIPEAERIEAVDCKLNLLEHVKVVQNNITRRFDQIEKELEVLEAEMGLSGDITSDEDEEESEDRDPATLQARALIKLIQNDIAVVKKVSEFSG